MCPKVSCITSHPLTSRRAPLAEAFRHISDRMHSSYACLYTCTCVLVSHLGMSWRLIKILVFLQVCTPPIRCRRTVDGVRQEWVDERDRETGRAKERRMRVHACVCMCVQVRLRVAVITFGVNLAAQRHFFRFCWYVRLSACKIDCP
jgi:hypothetical protein